jgi:hypothetical protein
MKQLNILKVIFGLIFMFTCAFANAHGAPTIVLDTTNLALQINGKVVDKTKIQDILAAIHHDSRKIEKPNKVIYVFDDFGFTIEEDSKGIAFKLFYAVSEKESDPKSAFAGKFSINTTEVIPSLSLEAILKQIPKTEKTLSMPNMLMIMGKSMIVSVESNKGIIKEFDFGFIKN